MEASYSTVERVRALDSKEVEQTTLNPAKAVAILASCVDEPPIDSTWESVRREQGVALDRQLQIFRTLQGELDHVAEAATVLSERFPDSMLSASYRQVERMIEGGRKKRESRIIVRGKSAPSLEALKGRIDLLREGAPTEISNLERAGDSFFRVFKAEIRNFADSIAGVPEGVINRQCQRFSDMMGRVTPLVNLYNFAEADARGDLASTGLNVPNWGPNSAAKRLELSGGIALPTILLTANPSPGSPSLREILNQAMEENATARTLLDSLPKAAAFFSTNAGRWMVAILPSYKFLSSYVSGIHPVLSDGRDELALSSFDSSFTIGEYRAVTKKITAQDSQLGEEAGYILRELDKTAEVAGITGAEFDELPFPLTLARVAQAKHDLAEMVGRAKGEEVFLEFFKDNRELLTLQNEQYDQYAARVHGILKDLSGFPLGEKWSLSRTPERFRYAALDRTEQEAREIALQSLGLEEAEGLLPGRTYGELMKLSVIAKELQIGCGLDTGEFVQSLGERVLHRSGESYREDLMTVAQIGRSSPKG
ncbi:MAG: hypothetical protein KDD70_18270, partial [Bdellovibrionales bacterium]|nr:hypothetical protein [Bdellovibrionales bacterium]